MMTNEEFDRKMAFIVNQQAKFAVDIDLLRESQARTDERIDRLTEKQEKATETLTETLTLLGAKQMKTEEVVTRLAYVTNVGFKDLGAKVDALVDSQILLRDSQQQLDERLRDSQKQLDERLRDSQKQLDERLTAKIESLAEAQKKTEAELLKLTATVDRYISRRNGG